MRTPPTPPTPPGPPQKKIRFWGGEHCKITAAAVGSRSQCSNPILEDFGPKTCPSGTFGHYFLSGKSSSGLLRMPKWVFGSKSWHLGQNIGIWVKILGIWVKILGIWVKILVFGSKYGIFVLCLALCTGYNLCASRRRTLRGLFFAKKSVLEMRIRYFLNFNKKCQNLIIIVDLA